MSATFEVAHTNEQGVDFLVVLVKPRVLSSPRDQEELAAFFQLEYGQSRSPSLRSGPMAGSNTAVAATSFASSGASTSTSFPGSA